MTDAKNVFSQRGLTRMREAMTGYVDRGEVPSIVTLLWRRGEVHVETTGSLSLGGNQAVRRDTIFRIASMTKPVTAAATMMLVEEGKLRLDNPVDRWLPELAGRRVMKQLEGPLDDTVPANRPISVRDLLTFRMGFGSVMAAPGTYPIQRAAAELRIRMGPPHPHEQPEPDEWMRRLGQLPLIYHPRRRCTTPGPTYWGF